MMNHVDAIYRQGVFQPLQPVHLHEDQRVRLNIEPAATETPESWLQSVQAIQRAVIERQGYLPDSSLDIASDRLR